MGGHRARFRLVDDEEGESIKSNPGGRSQEWKNADTPSLKALLKTAQPYKE